MRFRYDPASGALYFRVREGDIEETAELPTSGSYVDLDADGRVMGLEFLSVDEFLGFLLATGGEVVIPERVDPESPDLGRFALHRTPGEMIPVPVQLDQSAVKRVMQRAFDSALRALEDAETLDDEARHEQERNRADQPDATDAARRRAAELGVDLSELVGTGSEGRITVKDVVSAATWTKSKSDWRSKPSRS